MEDEINLRQYVDVLARRWKWIVGVTLLVADGVIGEICRLLGATNSIGETVFLQTNTVFSGGWRAGASNW